MPVPVCSFCGSTDQVQKLLDMEPAVYACESCAAFQHSIVRRQRGTGKRDDVRVLSNWTTIEVDRELFEWMAMQTSVSENRKPSVPMVMIIVQRIGREGMGVLFPDGTEPTEEVAMKAIRKFRERL